MKILQLIQKPQRRGAEIFASQLSQSLKEKGHEVLLVSIFEGNANLPFDGQSIELSRPISNRFFDLKGWKAFAEIIKEFQPDIVQANAADTLKFAVFSMTIFMWKSPLVYRNANQMGSFIKGTFHKMFNQFLLNRTAAVVSVSKASQEDFLKTFIYPKHKSHFIPIGILPEEIEVKFNDANALDFDYPFLLQIGGLVPEKDPLGMLQLFSQLKREELHLIIMGTGILEKTLSDQIENLGLRDRVHILQNQENVFPILRKAKVLVMPSKIEGLPAVILEAMYAKIPVVAYGVGGISEVLQKGQTGWSVTPDDQNGFLKAILEVLETKPDELQETLQRAHRLVYENYTLEKVSMQFERFYQEQLTSFQKP